VLDIYSFFSQTNLCLIRYSCPLKSCAFWKVRRFNFLLRGKSCNPKTLKSTQRVSWDSEKLPKKVSFQVVLTSLIMTTVHQRLVEPCLNIDFLNDWFKTGHVVWLLIYDWMILPPILFSEGQQLFGALYLLLYYYWSYLVLCTYCFSIIWVL
jgi:hypothetical protein